MIKTRNLVLLIALTSQHCLCQPLWEHHSKNYEYDSYDCTDDINSSKQSVDNTKRKIDSDSEPRQEYGPYYPATHTTIHVAQLWKPPQSGIDTKDQPEIVPLPAAKPIHLPSYEHSNSHHDYSPYYSHSQFPQSIFASLEDVKQDEENQNSDKENSPSSSSSQISRQNQLSSQSNVNSQQNTDSQTERQINRQSKPNAKAKPISFYALNPEQNQPPWGFIKPHKSKGETTKNDEVQLQKQLNSQQEQSQNNFGEQAFRQNLLSENDQQQSQSFQQPEHISSSNFANTNINNPPGQLSSTNIANHNINNQQEHLSSSNFRNHNNNNQPGQILPPNFANNQPGQHQIKRFSKGKNEIIVHKPAPIIVHRPPTQVVVKHPPLIVKPAPVIFHRPAPVIVRPIFINKGYGQKPKSEYQWSSGSDRLDTDNIQRILHNGGNDSDFNFDQRSQNPLFRPTFY